MSVDHHRVDRRRFLGTTAGLGLGAASFALVGCGDDDDDNDTGGPNGGGGQGQSPTPSGTTTNGGSADAPQRGGVLRTATNVDVEFVNAATQFSVTQGAAISLMYSTLVRRTPPNGEVVPEIADSWEQPDDTGLKFTFKLNPNVRFHDGTPVTANDVKATYEYYLSDPPDVDARKTQALREVIRIDAVSDNVLSMELSSPRATFLDFMGMGYQWIVPAKQLLDDITWFNQNVNGTGPFRLDSWQPDVAMSMKRNEDYFREGLPYLDEVDLQVVPDSVTRLSLYEANRLDMSWVTTYLSDQEFQRLNNRDGWVVHNLPSDIFTGFFMFGLEEPTKDPRVRRAVNLAFDRRAAITVLGNGRGAIGGYFTPGSQWSISEDELLKRPGFSENKDAEIAEAKKLLESAGYDDGVDIWSFLNTTSQPEVGRAVNLFCQDQLARAGIRLDPRPMESAELSKLRNEDRDWNAYALQSISRSGSDPDFAAPHLARGNLFGLRDDKAFDLFDKQSATLDPDERKKVVKELEEYLFEIVPYAPMYFAERATAVSTKVQGFLPTADIYQFVTPIDGVWLRS